MGKESTEGKGQKIEENKRRRVDRRKGEIRRWKEGGMEVCREGWRKEWKGRSVKSTRLE